MRSFVIVLISVFSMWASSVIGASVLSVLGMHFELSKSSITEIQSLMHHVPLLDGLSPTGKPRGDVVLKYIHNILQQMKIHP